MNDPISGIAHRPASRFELSICYGAIVLAILGQIALTHSWALFTRPLWIDEVYTQTVASAADIGTMLRGLSAGGEAHMPTTYVLIRWFSIPFGGVDRISLRVFAFLSTTLGLLGIYACLRLFFVRAAAIGGLFVAWSHHLVVQHAFDGRFYGPLLAAAVWFAYFILASRLSAHARAAVELPAGIIAIFLFTDHYFGCFHAGLILLFDWVAQSPRSALHRARPCERSFPRRSRWRPACRSISRSATARACQPGSSRPRWSR
jgi:hypothetical protein